VLSDPGLYPVPDPGFEPELEPDPEPVPEPWPFPLPVPEPDPDPVADPVLVPEPLPELDPPLESEPLVGVNRWLKSRVVLDSFSDAWTSIPNSLHTIAGQKLVAGQSVEARQTVGAEELQPIGVASPNPKWISALALRRRSLVWS
jgi:hypothetical protein